MVYTWSYIQYVFYNHYHNWKTCNENFLDAAEYFVIGMNAKMALKNVG